MAHNSLHASEHQAGGSQELSLAGLSGSPLSVQTAGMCTGFEAIADSTLAFVDGTRTFSITPTGADFSYWIKGTRYTKSAQDSVVITDTEGMWYIYYAGATLTASQTHYDFIDHAPVAILNWDATNNIHIDLQEERHPISPIDGRAHEYLHSTVGSRFESGLTAGDYTLTGNGNANADIQLSLTNGIVWDEDLKLTIANGAGSYFEQTLSPIANIPIFYRLGAGGPWRRKDATVYPLIPGSFYSATRCAYNLDTAGTWSLAEPTNTNYIATWLFATSNIQAPIIGVLGQGQYASLTEAQAGFKYESIAFGTMPFVEMKLLYRLIYQTANTYGNVPKARLRGLQDLRAVSNLPAGTYVATAHGSLTGLTTGDPHTQYLPIDGSRSMTGDFGFKVYSQADQPTLSADNTAAIWIDTDNAKTYLIFRYGAADHRLV